MDEQDPGLHFFPDGNVDLYGTLGVDKDATQDQIKKAYKKCVPPAPRSPFTSCDLTDQTLRFAVVPGWR